MVRRVLTFVLAALVLAGAAPAMPARAASSSKQQEIDRARKERKEQIKREISSLREEVQDASEEEAQALGELDEVRNRRRDLDGMVAEIDGRIEDVEATLDEAADAFDALTANLVQTELRLEQALAQETAARNELRDRAVAAYINPTHMVAAGMMLRADDMREMAATQGYYKAIIQQRKDALDKVTELKDKTEDLRADVLKRRDEAKAQQDVILDRKRELQAARDEQYAVRQEVFAEEQREAALVSQIRERKAEFESQIAALQAESGAITQLLQGLQVGQIAVPPGGGRLSFPVPGARITSPFGPRVHPIFGDSRMHTGIDIGAGSGTPIRASADGVVVFAGGRGGYGNATIIDHGGSLATLYAHQSSIGVSAGQTVTRGQVIGAVGCSGYCTGPHLHFEARVDGSPVNPVPYF